MVWKKSQSLASDLKKPFLKIKKGPRGQYLPIKKNGADFIYILLN
jgi:hypothetical protein